MIMSYVLDEEYILEAGCHIVEGTGKRTVFGVTTEMTKSEEINYRSSQAAPLLLSDAILHDHSAL